MSVERAIFREIRSSRLTVLFLNLRASHHFSELSWLEKKIPNLIITESIDEVHSLLLKLTPDLALIAIKQIFESTFDLVAELRAMILNPLLMVCDQPAEASVLRLYKAGVDDCIFSPISPDLLAAKIQAWSLRSWTISANNLEKIKVGQLIFSPMDRTFTKENKTPAKLTNLEICLLHVLMRSSPRIVPQEELIVRIWGHHRHVTGGALKNLVHRLRKKIEDDPDHPRHILTVSGMGYQFVSRNEPD